MQDSSLSPENLTQALANNYALNKKKASYKGKGLDTTGRPRNFYNPPGKVMKHLA